MAWQELTPFGAFGHAPELRAAPIGEVARSIMEQRLWQQKNAQDQIANLAKTIEAQRSGKAFIDAAQATGVLPAGEFGGLGTAGPESAAALARLIQQSEAEKNLSKYRDIPGGAAQTRAARGGVTPAGVDYSEHAIGDTWIDPDSGIRMIMGRYGPHEARYAQTSDVKTQSQNQALSEQNTLLQQKSVMDAELAKERAANIAAGKAGVPYSRSDEYNRTVNRLNQIARMQTMPRSDVITPSPGVRDADVQQAQDAMITPTPIPSATPPGAPGQESLPTDGAQTGGQDPVKRQQAISILQQNGKPTSEANINYVIGQLGQ